MSIAQDHPAINTTVAEERPDTLAQAADLLARYAAGGRIAPEYSDRDKGVLLGGLLYAVACELRRIANALEANHA